MRGIGASIMGGGSGGHPLVPQVKLHHLRSPTLEDNSIMSSHNGGGGVYSVVNSGVSCVCFLMILLDRAQTDSHLHFR
jgi:hypothetical protein